MGTEESGWTKENLQKLLAAIKTNIPENERKSCYTKTMKTIDWSQVAFPPYSPESCEEKWRLILQKMRKIRTLEELVVEAEDIVSDPKLNAKIHPEFPKKPSPPNAIYFEENRAKFRRKHPELSNTELLSLAITKFKCLSDHKRARYVEKFELANEEYTRKMEEFGQQYGKIHVRKVLKRKRDDTQIEDEDVLPLKPPFNGYNLFCKEQVTSKNDALNSTYVKVWAQRWRDLGEKKRREYSARCEELKKQYAIDLKTYLKRFDEEQQQEIIRKNGITPKDLRKIKTCEKKLPSEPKKPARSGNAIFWQTQMELLKEKIPNSKDRFTEVSKMWKNLSAKEKEYYQGQVKEKMKKYHVDLQAWFKALPEREQDIYRMHNPSKCEHFAVTRRTEGCERGKSSVYQPSDSEDEDIMSSSTDDEDEDIISVPFKDEEKVDGDMFEIY